MAYFFIKVTIHLLSFMLSFYALSAIQFDKFMNVQKPLKVQLLLLLASMGLGYLVAQFLFAIAF